MTRRPKSPRPRRRAIRLAALIGCLTLGPLAAHARTAAEFYESALERYHGGQYAEAMIELKNALQQERSYLPAQVLMGLTHLRQGQPVEAEAVLREAKTMGADPAITDEPLGEALLAQGRPEDLLAAIGPDVRQSPATRAAIVTLRGRAYVALFRYREAIEEFRAAIAEDPTAVGPWTGLNTVALRQGDLTEAAATAERALALGPESAGAWNARASVRHAQGDLEGALADYAEAIARDETHVEARLARAGILIDLGRDASALPDLDALTKQVPFDPRASYLKALSYSRAGNREEARKHLTAAAEIAAAMPREMVVANTALLLVAGLSNYSLERFDQARPWLEKYIELHPGAVGASKVLGNIMVRSGEADLAIRLLRPLVARAPNDPDLLTMLADAHANKGDHAASAAMLERALAVSGDSASLRTKLAMSQIQAGEWEPAIEGLGKAFFRPDGHAGAGVALTVLHMKQGEFERAAEVARALVERQPRNAQALNLLASALVRTGDRVGAREALEKSLALDGTLLSARINLGRLERLEGDEAAARRRFLAILEGSPDEIQPMLELASLDIEAGRDDEGLRWLEKARGAGLRAIGPRLRLVEFHLRRDDAAAALAVAEEAEKIEPENLQVLNALARAANAGGDRERALTVYRAMSDLAQHSPVALQSIAVEQSRAGAWADALASLDRALAAAPDFLPARLARVEALQGTGQMVEAETAALDLRQRHPEVADAHRLLGDIQLKRGRCESARSSYDRAMQLAPDPRLVVGLYRAEAACGNDAAGIAHIEAWLAEHPDDAALQQALAEAWLRAGMTDRAIAQYERVLAAAPARIDVLNNLAYLLAEKDPSRARAHAERAHELAPGDPSVNDTLGWVMVQAGDAARALPYLREAQSRRASSGSIRYHLAVALQALGRTKEALAELDQALALGDFPDAPAARALRATLVR
ncbi:MAG: PEP-CTERM system TPR-repeat protein PrsT [Ectothiorhodospiraceae bacterium]|nr:PEP-CTERM system TPR-repeat protein PrsT [Chromatiales bacterium]MCP5153701.1 PEP-CTERM system TPR-repeat protein PrsT [Ectothiorhodospiraceae bacterium]